MIAVKAILLAVLVILGTTVTPQLHNHFLRSYVGTKTFKVLDIMEQGGGTGFLVKAPSGKVYILSNAHVCEPMYGGLVIIESPTGEKLNSIILEIDSKHDLCLIKAPEGSKGLSVASEEPDIGTLIYNIGFPLLGNLSVSGGEVLSTEMIEQFIAIKIDDHCEGFIEDYRGTLFHMLFGVEALCVFDELATLTSSTVYPGNSGSPTVDGLGRVVGVLYMTSTVNHNLSYSVPVSAIHAFLKDK
jgi:S1-C subfamily serine protease